MARNTNIKLRRSATAGAIPTTSNLDLGELALNTYDGKLYAKTTEGSASEVIQVGSSTDSYHKIRKSQTLSFAVTVDTKTTDHAHHGSGSSSGYFIDGLQSPHLHLVPGNTYKFDQSDSSNSGHPLRFYYDAAKTTAYTTGVTTSGTPGSSGAYTQIVPTDTTPTVLHYQCSSHGYMGGRADFSTRTLTGFDTDDLTEGSSNLYFTNARARAAVSVTDAGGDGSLAYNSSTGVITYTGPSAAEVRAHFSAGTGIGISGGTISTSITQYANSDVETYLDANGTTFPDNIKSFYGTGSDLSVYHSGSHSYIENSTGNLILLNNANDKDIILQSDDGSGGAAAYITVDGSAGLTQFDKHTKHTDSIKAYFGNSSDLQIYHDGSHSIIKEDGTGDLRIDGDSIYIRESDGTNQISAAAGTAILYKDGTARVTTTSGGATIGGVLTADTVNTGQGATEVYLMNQNVRSTDDVTFDDLTLTGNLTVGGTTTTLNTATLDVEDKNITLNAGSGDTSGSADGAGITIQDAVDASNNATLLWDATNDRFDFSHPLEITNNGTTDTLLLTSTEASSTAAPVITLKRNSGSPADADYLGQLKFKGENDADEEIVYAKITAKIQDASDASEDGLIEFANKKAGANVITARLKSDKLQLLNSTGLEVAGLTYPTSDGSNGQALVTDGSGNLSFSTISAGGNAFGTIAVSGQTNVVADSNSDTLTLAAGSNITLTTTAGTDTVTIAASGGEVTVQDEGSALSTAATTLNFVGAGVTATGTGATKTVTIPGTGTVSEAFKTIAVSGSSDVVADGATDTLTLAAGSGMTISTTAGTDTITFASTGSSSMTSVYKEYVYAPSSSTTTFTGSDANGNTLSYTVDYIKVYLNGILLKPTTDYTATNGTSVVLVNAAGANDTIQISTFVQLVGTGDSSLSELSGNGSTTAFTIAANPNHENNTQVYIDGVYQEKSTYSVSGTTLTFSTAPPNGSSIEVVIGSRNVTVDDVEGLTVSNGLTTDTITASGAGSITGNLDIASALRHIGDTDTELLFATNDIKLKAGGATHFHAASDQTTTLYSGNASALYLDTSQKVGIGTTSPGVSLDIANKTDAIRVPNGTTAQRPTAAVGQLRYNTTTSEFEGYSGSGWGAIGGGGDAFGTIAISGQSNVVADQENDTLTFAAGTGITLTTNASSDTVTITNSATGANAFGNVAVSGQTTIAADSTNDTLTIVGAGGITATTTAGTDTLTLTGQTSINPFTTDLFTTANNSTTAFTLSVTPPSENNLIVFLEGAYQNKNSYTLSGTTLTLDSAPASGSEVVVHIIQNGVVGAGHTVDEFTGNGSTAAYTLSVAPLNENSTFVYLDGVYQEKSTYSVSGTTLTFDTNVTSGHSIEVVTPTVTEINQPATDSINAIGMFDDTTIMGSAVTSTTMTTTSATTIATHAAATYRTIKYIVQLTQGTDYHSTEINLIHDGSTVYISEYGTLFDNAVLGTLSATISSGNVLLQLTPGSNSSLTARVVSTAIPV